MKNPFKSKTGEKPNAAMIAVLTGLFLVIATMIMFFYTIFFINESDRAPVPMEALEWSGMCGVVLLVGGTLSAWMQNNPIYRFGLRCIFIGILLSLLAGIFIPTVDKPVIYLYPPQEEAVTVRLDFAGKITALYPAFDEVIGGWQVTAFPDGHLTDPRDGREYSYLFWEGEGRTDWDLSTGFVVRGSDTRQFLQDTLPKLGLTPREYNEFIVYWYPKMQASRFNLIHFAGREYTDTAVLNVNPPPDSVIRVFMVWKPLATEISLPPQFFPPVDRHGFSVVEWGGTEVR